MSRVLRHPLFVIALLAVALAAAVLAERRHRFVERAWFEASQFAVGEEARAAAVWLPDYRAVIQHLPLAGIVSDLSALTYDPDRNVLLSLTNKRTELIELTLDGDVLRRIPLVGFGDPEALEYIAPGTFVITEERNQQLHKVHLDELTQHIEADQGERLSLSLDVRDNKGLEGSAFDVRSGRLFVAKERDPLRILEIDGFAQTGTFGLDLHVKGNPARDAGLFLGDLSSLAIDPRTGHLLALSDESRMLLELGEDGEPLSALSLEAGRHGLETAIPQAEGVAMDRDGNIYVISEPNLFYKFSKAPSAEDA